MMDYNCIDYGGWDYFCPAQGHGEKVWGSKREAAASKLWNHVGPTKQAPALTLTPCMAISPWEDWVFARIRGLYEPAQRRETEPMLRSRHRLEKEESAT